MLGLFCCAGFSLLVERGGYSPAACVGISLWWLLLLQSTCSRCVGFSSSDSQVLGHRLNSCGARDQLLRGTWNLPRSGIQPVSPALAGRFFTTEPPGKPSALLFKGRWIQTFGEGRGKPVHAQGHCGPHFNAHHVLSSSQWTSGGNTLISISLRKLWI